MALFCANCGNQIPEGNAFCTSCGTAVDASEAPSNDAALSGEGIAPDKAATVPDQPVTSQGQPAAPADPTMTIPVSQVQQPVAPPPATSSPTVAGPQPTMVTPPPITQPATTYTTSAPTSTADNHKTWMVVGIAAAAVIVAAVAVILFVVLGNNSSSPSPINSGAAAGGGRSTASANCTITYNTNGGSTMASSNVASGYSLSKPTDPTKSGYTFAGWYLDSGYTQEASFPYTVTSDTTLYAKWDGGGNTSSGTTSVSGTTSGTTSGGTVSNSTTKTLTVVGKNGDTRTAEIHLSGTTGRVFPDSNSRELTQAEINQKSDAEKCIAWNEIIASSNGYSFKNSGLRTYFNSCSWYREVPGADPGGNLNAAAGANVKKLQASCDSWWLSLAAY